MSKHYSRSFAAGEIASTLYGRLDLAKFQTGLAKCLNFVVTPQGPIENRAGTEYVNHTKHASVPPALIPFTYNSEQSFALEFGEQYVRFHTQGGTLLETGVAITGITQGYPAVVTSAGHGFANGDQVYLSGIGGMSALNARWAIVGNVTANTYTLHTLFGLPMDTLALPVYTAGGTAARVYEITTPYTAADVFDLHYVQSADVLTLVHENYQPRELRRLAATNWSLTTITFLPALGTPAAPGAGGGGIVGPSPIDHFYVQTGVAAGEESPPSAPVTVNWDLTVSGAFINIVPSALSGAVRYNIYKDKAGIYGYIGQSAGAQFTDNNIDPDMSKTPPEPSNPFSGASEYPRAVSYFEQRRSFGGSINKPQNVWMTRSGTESNFTYSIPAQDDDSITARIVAREGNAVRHLVPLNDLLALTSGGVWKLSGSDSGAITPATFSAKPQGYVGASNVQPVVTSSSVIYAPDRGAHMRELSYRWETQTYQSDDVSVLAPHLFDFKTITQIAYAKTPIQIMWAVRNDGVLLGLTHQPEHEIKAWHQHTTQGNFVSVCVVPEGDEDGLYVVVDRTIQGGQYHYIERMHTRQIEDQADAFFVDAGASYSGAPATEISGLWHLEGEEVTILADGGVEPTQTVENGSITLSEAASKVHIGLPYTCDAQTLPLSMEVEAFGQGAMKNISEVFLRVESSAGIEVGPDFDHLRDYTPRSSDDGYGDPPAMVEGMVSVKLTPAWQRDGTLCIRQSNPLPLTITSITLDVARGG
jgi:hypothetical protein